MTLSAVAARYANALADVVTARGSARPEAALAELRAFEAALANRMNCARRWTPPPLPAAARRRWSGASPKN